MEKILAFGASQCYQLNKEILQRQYDIVALVDNDKRKIGKSLDGKTIISPQEIKRYYYDYIFITSIYYSEILNQLIELGIDQEKIRWFDELQYNNNKELFLHDYSYIKHHDNYIIAYIPIELLYTEKYETALNKVEHITEEWKKSIEVWQDINLVRLKPHRKLFYFFRGLELSIDDYIEWYEGIFKTRKLASPISSKQVIDKKYREYMMMSRELNKGMDFFINNPIDVTWNEKGYFNIIDGHHRAMFLYCSGLRKIPTKIKTTDYCKWLNTEAAIKCLDIINDQERIEFYTPIVNPYFMNKISYRDSCFKSRLDYILEFFSAHRFSNYKILDVGSALGYYSQHFSREGANVTAIEPDKKHYELAKRLNDLLFTSYKLHPQKIEELDMNNKYDICIMLTVFYHFFNDLKLREQIIEVIDKVTNKFLIWESGDISNAEREKSYILSKTKFNLYIKLGNTYGTGKVRELGIFTLDSDFKF